MVDDDTNSIVYDVYESTITSQYFSVCSQQLFYDWSEDEMETPARGRILHEELNLESKIATSFLSVIRIKSSFLVVCNVDRLPCLSSNLPKQFSP